VSEEQRHHRAFVRIVAGEEGGWMPQHKVWWVGGPTRDPRFEEVFRQYENNPTNRPQGPLLPASRYASVIPEALLTDNRLPPHAVRVYGALQGFAHPSDTEDIAWFCVHDRIIAIYTGVPIDVVKYARKKLEKYGYIRLRLGSSTRGDWHKGYQGHWHGRNVPPTYEIDHIKGAAK